ncbi:fatty acid oxidation complex subunit alpha [Gossypium hirsutum]|uniref:Fatty acid oxidation complex subunit alpha n=1 Tax=Gossypium hirsutum TaxID=3635 RepID=A0ABM2ZJL0_GOSHI|nr:fatty acid oxidation complex subunit alpha-like [Gossypium hirsutum]
MLLQFTLPVLPSQSSSFQLPPISPLPQIRIPNPMPDCPPPFFLNSKINLHLQHQSTSTDPPPVLHGSTHFQNQRLERSYKRLLPLNFKVTDEEITKMVLFPTINEACRVLDEGVVARASDLDVASVLGMSFPSYCFGCSGGIMFWADTVGSKHIYLSLKKWSER